MRDSNLLPTDPESHALPTEPPRPNSNTKALWATVKGKKSKTSDVNNYRNILTSPDLINQFFATIATDEKYDLNEILQLRIVRSLLMIMKRLVAVQLLKLKLNIY